MHSFLCFSKIGFLHDIDLYLGSLSLENCDFDSKQLSLPVAISACRAAPMGANPLGHTFKPLTLYDISIYTIYFSHPQLAVLCFEFRDVGDAFFQRFFIADILVVDLPHGVRQPLVLPGPILPRKILIKPLPAHLQNAAIQ